MKIKKVGIIIFVRLNSRRLPLKAFKKVQNTFVLDHIYRRIKKVDSKTKIIIATTKSNLDKKIVAYCKKNHIYFFRGSGKDVALRAINCCKKYKFDSFLRVCADRIFFDYKLAKKMIKFYQKNNYEVVTNSLYKTFPKGLACEIINYKTFKANYKYMNLSDKEHIFNYFYRNKKKFKIKNFSSGLSKKIFGMNMSLDKRADLIKIQKAYRDLRINSNTETKKIINYYYKTFY